MERHHDSPGVDVDSRTNYSSHTTIVPPPTPNQSLQVDLTPQIWGLGRELDRDSSRRYSWFSKRESVVIRDSVAYPSESSFEATIKEGTAQTGRRTSTKPRLVDLDRIRRKISRIKRHGSRRSAVTETESTASTAGAFDTEDPDVMPSPTTSRQAVTAMYHETQNDIMLHTRSRSAGAGEPMEPFRDRIRGRDFSRTAGDLESGISVYAQPNNRDAHKNRSCPSLCVIL
ncbi:hypothetical protein F5Y05DRAFT_107715 [Hypoxylon sp. FL0543]|nr:hypothetical protein F5Y05DRAFT_107715 [Hypoxylon sp. FL0543]